jgi:hypothetical protein
VSAAARSNSERRRRPCEGLRIGEDPTPTIAKSLEAAIDSHLRSNQLEAGVRGDSAIFGSPAAGIVSAPALSWNDAPVMNAEAAKTVACCRKPWAHDPQARLRRPGSLKPGRQHPGDGKRYFPRQKSTRWRRRPDSRQQSSPKTRLTRLTESTCRLTPGRSLAGPSPVTPNSHVCRLSTLRRSCAAARSGWAGRNGCQR